MNDNHIVPLYQQVKEDIKAAIESGKFAPREKIPSEPELSAEYSVSRITVRRAVDELCADGYLIKMQGRGTYVGTPRIHRKFTGGNIIESFTETCRSNGMVAGGRLVGHQVVPASHEDGAFLKLKPGAPLLFLRRVRTADGVPIFLENLFLPYDEYKDITTREDLDNASIFRAIEEVSGRRPVGAARRTIEINRASAERAELLEIPISEPLLYLNVYFVDKGNQPICIGRQYYIGTRYMFDLGNFDL